MAAITWEAYFVIFVLITVFACLIKGFRTPEIIFFGGLIACWNATIISTDEAVSGFSNTGLLTVGVLNVVIKGVERSGAAARVCRRAFGSKTSFRMGMLRMQSLCYLISGFFNNTPIVALLIPITRDWARQRGFAPSHFLIPLSFAAIFGGTLTIIGTSTNLLVNGLLADAGFAQFGFFEPAYVGAPLGLFGIAYCVLLADRLLPVRGGLFRAARDRAQEMLTQVEVLEDFAYADQTLEAVCGKLNLPFSAVVKLRRPKVVARSRVPTEGQLQLSDMAAGGAAGRRRAASEAAWGTPHDLDVLQGPRSSRRNSKEHAKESPRAAADPAAEILKLPLAAAAGGPLAPVAEGGAGEEEGGDGASSDGGGGGGDDVRPPAPAAKATLYRRGGGGNGNDDGEEGKSGEPQLIWNLEDGMPYRDFFPVSKNQGCRVGDVLFLSLGRAALLQLAGEKRAQGLNLLDTAAADLAGGGTEYYEVVLSATHPSVGRPFDAREFAERYQCSVLAHRQRKGLTTAAPEDVVGGVQEINLWTPHPGDTLLLLAKESFYDTYFQASDFYLISRIGLYEKPVTWWDYVPSGLFLVMLGLVAAEVVDILRAAMTAALVFTVAGWVDSKKAASYVDWRLLLLIGSALGVSQAITNSGLSNAVADAIASSNLPPSGAIFVLFAFTVLCTELVTNNAAAALGVPIATATAEALGVSHKPFAMAVMIAASMSFITPIGYQTNTMVWGPGGYNFGDYAKIGAPLSLCNMIFACFYIPLVFPFSSTSS